MSHLAPEFSSHSSINNANLPIHGVGITYAPELEPAIFANQDLLDYIEIEPQMVWLRTGSDDNRRFVFPKSVMEHLQTLPGRKLIHSVGMPVGGNLAPDPGQLRLLRETVDYYKPAWASEHMGFNATHEFQTGFFLPQKQTPQGVQVAVDNIKRLQDALGIPIAIETGVNYLRPRSGEMADGDFVAAIIEAADCGLLLDLHNLFTNEMNGRQRILDFLTQIPLQRVWELHLAGGIEMDGFWLDAHSGAMPQALLETAEQVIPRFPNLRAITFEMLASYLELTGENVVREQLQAIHKLWARRGETPATIAIPTPKIFVPAAQENIETTEWERVLSRLATGYQSDERPPLGEFSGDPGINILNKLINEFRASMLVNTLRLSSRYMMLTFGLEAFQTILQDFWEKNPPRQFASEEAENFIAYLREHNVHFPNLDELLAYEESAMYTLLDGQARVVTFHADPFPLFRALTEGNLPTLERQVGVYEVEITPDVILN